MDEVLRKKAKRTSKTISKMKTSDFKEYAHKHNPKLKKLIESKKPHKVKKEAVLGLKKLSKEKKGFRHPM